MTYRRTLIWATFALGVATAAGLLIHARSGSVWPVSARSSTQAHEIWTCPMHPDIREHEPGTCPRCGMDLVKERSLQAEHGHEGSEADQAGGTPSDIAGGTPRASVQLDTRRRQLLGVGTARVQRTAIDRQLRAVGLVRYDETRLSDVNLKLDGWVQKLHIGATGQPVRRGQPLLDLYSPELLATQDEYLLALATRETMQQSQIEEARTHADRLVESARRRLALWDLPADEMERLDRSRKANATITFRSPVSGVVIEKPVVEGMRIMPGQTLYKIADLSTVWVEADVYESDAPFIKAGTPASVTLDAWPGESLRGRAVFIYPFVDERTRTLSVRFAFPNPSQRLKPGMYANIEMASSLGSGLTIPADALLDAGRERLVFVVEGDGYYSPRTVQIGHRLGERVQIQAGLEEGEVVATGAAFFLDSESQLRAATGGWDVQTADTAPAAPSGTLSIVFRTQPDPPRSGENTFEVALSDPSGPAVTDAQVRVVLHMPAMPSMNMPAMTSEAKLTHAGGGVYRGKGMVGMAGRWDVTVIVTRDGQRIGSTQTTVVAR